MTGDGEDEHERACDGWGRCYSCWRGDKASPPSITSTTPSPRRSTTFATISSLYARRFSTLLITAADRVQPDCSCNPCTRAFRSRSNFQGKDPPQRNSNAV